ncbi:hypothetical protein Agabi119p4_1548 [Agaricus bisporus var. burnettii]|uniref:Uncharacterized protein n=1 Tax=Agaricus bisporus var. burnettii TaxID=192524 RepID=A0A8H7F7J0_AGABI|nr:hypothetical protein Agabi119p4_1548 [Agaricus bisporus var. burnettii]
MTVDLKGLSRTSNLESGKRALSHPILYLDSGQPFGIYFRTSSWELSSPINIKGALVHCLHFTPSAVRSSTHVGIAAECRHMSQSCHQLFAPS